MSRRHFLLSTSLATTALGFESLTGMGALARGNPARASAPGKWCLWYDRPAKAWMTEALPIGNGPMGAMLFGGVEVERIQFNEISLWSGDRLAIEGRVLGESAAEEEQNLLDSHPPFQIDGNFGATAGYCEMLVHSHTGWIHLLPALPKAWPTGKVTGLCARGGFEVEMSWEAGSLTKAVIHSKSGLPCRVVYGDKSWEFHTQAGKSYPLKLAEKSK